MALMHDQRHATRAGFSRLFPLGVCPGMASLVVSCDTKLAHSFAYTALRTSGTTFGRDGSAPRAVTYSETRSIADSKSDSATIL
jgi:hypothetical protein